MRRIALLSAAIALVASPAFAQDYIGNWACYDANATKTGILTIYGQVYGFASATYGDPSSGTGTITAYQDGVGFNDGPLRASRNIEAGRIVPNASTGLAVQLETAEAATMLCTPR